MNNDLDRDPQDWLTAQFDHDDDDAAVDADDRVPPTESGEPNDDDRVATVAPAAPVDQVPAPVSAARPYYPPPLVASANSSNPGNFIDPNSPEGRKRKAAEDAQDAAANEPAGEPAPFDSALPGPPAVEPEPPADPADAVAGPPTMDDVFNSPSPRRAAREAAREAAAREKEARANRAGTPAPVSSTRAAPEAETPAPLPPTEDLGPDASAAPEEASAAVVQPTEDLGPDAPTARLSTPVVPPELLPPAPTDTAVIDAAAKPDSAKSDAAPDSAPTEAASEDASKDEAKADPESADTVSSHFDSLFRSDSKGETPAETPFAAGPPVPPRPVRDPEPPLSTAVARPVAEKPARQGRLPMSTAQKVILVITAVLLVVLVVVLVFVLNQEATTATAALALLVGGEPQLS